MAVFIGGAPGSRVAYNQADDNAADRILAFRAQVGLVLTPDQGVILSEKIGNELAEIDVGISVYADGRTYGTNRLTSISSPFTPTMVGLSIIVSGHGQRVIELVTAANDIEVSGSVMPINVGLRFTTPLGTAAFDCQVSLSTTLTNTDSPFYPELVGRNVYLVNFGLREVLTYVSADEITIAGPAIANQILRVMVPVFMERAERGLWAGSQIVDSHRLPAMNTATTIRWQMGPRPRRGVQRTVV
jgi:hypothetical protein